MLSAVNSLEIERVPVSLSGLASRLNGSDSNV